MKRFLKRFIWTLPLAWGWAAFYVGDVILISPMQWYTFPYLITCFIILFVLIAFSDKISSLNL
jgi:hypothetical protein